MTPQTALIIPATPLWVGRDSVSIPRKTTWAFVLWNSWTFSTRPGSWQSIFLFASKFGRIRPRFTSAMLQLEGGCATWTKLDPCGISGLPLENDCVQCQQLRPLRWLPGDHWRFLKVELEWICMETLATRHPPSYLSTAWQLTVKILVNFMGQILQGICSHCWFMAEVRSSKLPSGTTISSTRPGYGWRVRYTIEFFWL